MHSLDELGAMTIYGHASFDLAPHWKLMGTLEALNGMILIGLTTACLYRIIRDLLPRELEEVLIEPLPAAR